MRVGWSYLVEYQAIRQVKTINIPKHGKTHFKRRQITIQNVAFYNAICTLLEIELCTLLEIEQKPTKQQPK